MKRVIKKLRLRRGDILVVSDAETRRRLVQSGAALPPDIGYIPIVLAPTGIQRLTVAQLKTILKTIEEKEEKKCVS